MLLRIVLAGLLLPLTVSAAPAPSVPAAVETAAPIDQVSRAKFPGEDPLFIDAVASINAGINHSITYVSDQVHYGVREHWVALPPDYKGDCEDYALSKQEILAEAGVPIVSHVKIRGVAVHVKERGVVNVYGHAILELRLPNGAIAILDNNHDALMTRAELERDWGYEFFNW